jgi:predicted DNA-binding transcriptional regulator YafY
VLERDPPRRAAGPGAAAGGAVVDIASRQPTRPEPSRTNPVQLARDLLDRADTAEPEASASLTFRRLLESRTRLGRHELRVLSHAIDHKEAVHIDYVDQNGSHTSRVISDIALFGSVVEAWCHLRQADRMFSLSGIESVSPAD